MLREEGGLEYTVVRGYTDDFLEGMAEMLAEGWIPQGGISFDRELDYREIQPGVKHKMICNYYAQAMVRRKQIAGMEVADERVAAEIAKAEADGFLKRMDSS